MNNLSILSKAIIRTGALSFGDYLLSSGKKSSYYIDLSLLLNHPDVFSAISKSLKAMVEDEVGVESIDRIAGITTKGAIYASQLSLGLMKPLAILERKNGSILYGSIEPDERIVLVDDTLNTGKTMSRCIGCIKRDAGGKVEHAAVIIDRMGGGNKKLGSMEVQVHSLGYIIDVAQNLLTLGTIESGEHEIIISEVKK